MPICVKSEIGPLRQVLLHRPGRELEQLMPEYLDQLLFDDIPYLKAAQNEHDYFAQVLRQEGAEVLYLADLAAETIRQSQALKERFVADFIAEAGPRAGYYAAELTEMLLAIPDEKELVLTSMAGVTLRALQTAQRGPLSRLMGVDTKFVLDPIPNLYFTRDPFATLGCGVSLNRMFSRTRSRETIYGRYILTHHARYGGQAPFYYDTQAPFSIEGGDLLNLSSRALAVGISQRTSPEAVELLARRIFSDAAAEIQTILALDIPNLRAYMHLDTVFTQVDYDKFTIHPAILERLELYRLDRLDDRGGFKATVCERSLAELLCDVMDLDDCQLINCGGYDQVASAREQWNDGANTLAVAPGRVVVYDRNTITNQALTEAGITVLQVPSSELSRGRGGPRCMSMPLLRDCCPRPQQPGS